MGHASETPKRILLVRTDRLGDVVLTLPMLSALRACFPTAYIAILLRQYTGGIVIGNPHADEIIWYDDGKDLLPMKDMVHALREKKFDTVVVVYPTFRLAMLMFRAGVPNRVGTGYRWYSILFNRRVYEHRKDAKRHEVEYNLRLLEELGCSSSEPIEFYIDIPAVADQRMRKVAADVGLDLSRPFAVVHPGSGGSARDWRAENFGVLAGRLKEKEGLQVVVTGSPHEREKIGRVVEASGGVALALQDELSLKELAALYRLAELFVSNSTGPMHIAAAVGTPVVGLFPQHKPMSERRWGPYSPKKRVLVPAKPETCKECFDGNGICECMESISVESVHKAAVDLLNQRVRRPG